MKKLFATIALLAIAGIARAAVAYPVGPATCKWTVMSQGLNFVLTSGKTNATATVTNTSQTFKSTVNRTNYNIGDLLTLIENSLGQTFPPGSQVGLRYNQLYVVDKTGTNALLNLNNLVTISFGLFLTADVRNQKTTDSSAGFSVTGMDASVGTIDATLNYDDSTLRTTDGTRTTFALHGLFTITSSYDYGAKIKQADSIVFEGTGEGTIRNLPVIITGTLNSKGKGAGAGF